MAADRGQSGAEGGSAPEDRAFTAQSTYQAEVQHSADTAAQSLARAEAHDRTGPRVRTGIPAHDKQYTSTYTSMVVEEPLTGFAYRRAVDGAAVGGTTCRPGSKPAKVLLPVSMGGGAFDGLPREKVRARPPSPVNCLRGLAKCAIDD